MVDVFEIPTGVAVVATDTYAARQGRDALKVAWDEAKAEKRSSQQISPSYYRRIAEGKARPVAERLPDRRRRLAGVRRRALRGRFDFPYLAHAAMEPMNCVAQVDGRSVEADLRLADPDAGPGQHGRIGMLTLPGEVEIETLSAGGSFGRRANFPSDYVVECVHIAKQVGGGRPVKLVWTREDDMRAGYYRPMVHHALRITCGRDGFPSAWRHHAVAQALVPFGPNDAAVEGVKGSPYLAATPVVDAKVFSPKLGVPVHLVALGGPSHTAMVMEHTIDQLARRASKDPVEYRRAIYRKAGDARHLAVLDLVCEKAGWGKPLRPAGPAASPCTRASAPWWPRSPRCSSTTGKPKVGRVVSAVDCGMAVAPNQIAAQMEGGVCYGLCAALYGERDAQGRRGRADQLRHLPGAAHGRGADGRDLHRALASPSRSGTGEPGTPVIGPAVANALLSLTGKATRSLPFVT